MCVCVTMKSAAFLYFTCTCSYTVLYGVFKVFIVWILLKTLLLRVLASSGGHHPSSLLPGELSMDKRNSDGFFSTHKVYNYG